MSDTSGDNFLNIDNSPESTPALSSSMRRRVGIAEIPWKLVFESVSRQSQLDVFHSQEIVKSFYRRLLAPFNIGWFFRRSYIKEDQFVLNACLETSAADSLAIQQEKIFSLWPLKLHYRFTLKISRDPIEEGFINQESVIRLKLLIFSLSLRSPWQVLAVHSLVTLLAAVLLFFALILLIFGFVNFLAFVAEPYVTIKKAWIEAPVGVSLLCFMVGVAGLGGRGISNLAQLSIALWKSIRGFR